MGYSICSCCGSTKLGVRLNEPSKLEPGEDSAPFEFHGVDWDPLDSIGVFGGLEASPEKVSKGAPGALERCVAIIRSKAERCWGSELPGCPDARWDKGCESWLDKKMAISLSAFSCSCLCTCRICSAMNVASGSTSALQNLSVSRYLNMAKERKGDLQRSHTQSGQLFRLLRLIVREQQLLAGHQRELESSVETYSTHGHHPNRLTQSPAFDSSATMRPDSLHLQRSTVCVESP